MHEFRDHYKEQPPEVKKQSTKPLNLDDLYTVKDYAFNNMMVVIGSDSVFSHQEREFAAKMAKKFGYRPEKIEELFLMARNGRLSIRMPDDPKMGEKIVRLMEKTAAADSHVTAGEKKLIDHVRENYVNAKGM
jgi:hypothetical protein